jgi:hypothetical protein
MQMANRGLEVLGVFIELIQIAFPFDFLFANPVSFVPVEFGFTHLSVPKPNHSDSFELTNDLGHTVCASEHGLELKALRQSAQWR